MVDWENRSIEVITTEPDADPNGEDWIFDSYKIETLTSEVTGDLIGHVDVFYKIEHGTLSVKTFFVSPAGEKTETGYMIYGPAGWRSASVS